MPIRLVFLTLSFPFFGISQQLHFGETYAIVVGISDYQNESVPDLQFADKDAESFADFLRSPAGGSIDENNLKVLLNEKATLAEFGAALGWTQEVAQENDKVIIYFSGHGDAENTTIHQLGFLLCWDASPQVYPMGGAFGLIYLEALITTLSIKNKANVIIIIDACRSGKLSGSAIGGAQIAGASLAKKYANEIKILSCQPNEYSIEGTQWGGGRGAFSYHLVHGLTGMADNNEDFKVSLMEINRFLEDHVSTEVAPLQQTPMIIGDRNEVLTYVHEASLNDLIEKDQTNLPQISKASGRIAETLAFMKSDSLIQNLYFHFERTLAEKKFFEPRDSCAEYYYQQLIEKPELSPIFSKLKRDYAVALQNDAQQVLNKLFEANTQEITQSRVIKVKRYKDYPHYIERSAELLGTDHYMHENLMARKFFFEGLLMWLENPRTEDQEYGQSIIDKYQESLNYESYAPHVHFYMSCCYASIFNNVDSTNYYAMEAAKEAETWVLPYAYMAYFYSKKFKDFDKAKTLIDKGMEIDSQDVFLLRSHGVWYFQQKRFNEAIPIIKKAISLDSTNAMTWLDLGVSLLITRQYSEAEKSFKKAMECDSTQYLSYYNLGILYSRTKRLKEAEEMLLSAIQLDNKTIKVRKTLAFLYFKLNQKEKSIKLYQEVLQLNGKDIGSAYNLACLFSEKGDLKSGLHYLELALKNGEDNYDDIMNEKELSPLRETVEFRKLMLKYFPNK